MIKSLTTIHKSIRDFFEDKIKDRIEQGSILDLFMISTASEIEAAYEYIEENKYPYIYTSLTGQNIDRMAKMCGFERRPNESDQNLLFRLINWSFINAKGNIIAIEAALLDMQHSSNITYFPRAYGAGTAICYVIPLEYTEHTIELALEEAKDRLKNVVSPSLYIEYVVPNLKAITISINVDNVDSNLVDIQKNIESKFAYYINSIPPHETLDVGYLERIGYEEPGVNYFSVTGVFVDGVPVSNVSITQDLTSKFIFDEIRWHEVS